MDEATETARCLRDLLEQQEACYREVLDLSRRQVELIQAKDTAALLEILSEKQARMQAMEEVTRQAGPLLAAWEDQRASVPEADRAAVEEMHERVKTVLARVLELEETSRQALEGSTDEAGRKVAQAQRGKQMLKAYGARPGGGQAPRFTDNRE